MNLANYIKRADVKLTSEELRVHVQASLDETHRELAWIRTSLIAFLYAVLSIMNYTTLDNTMRLEATFF